MNTLLLDDDTTLQSLEDFDYDDESFHTAINKLEHHEEPIERDLIDFSGDDVNLQDVIIRDTNVVNQLLDFRRPLESIVEEHANDIEEM